MELTRVYDTSQVDAYVAHLHQQIDVLNGELATLRERLALPAGPDETEAAERILGRVLLRAQQVADEAVADGFRERDELLADAHRGCAAIREGAQSEAANMIAEAEEMARTIVERAHEAREMQALVDEVRGSQGDDDAASAPPPLHEVVNFPWAGNVVAREPVAPVTPPRIVAAPPTGAPVIPLVGPS